MLLLKKIYVTLRDVGKHPLNRGAKARAMWNFCVSQVAARLTPGDICVPFPNQTGLLLSPRMKGAAHFICPGLCEFEPMSFVMHYLRADDLFVDIGANVGAYTLLASGVAGAKSVSVEPCPGTFDYLVRNVRLNDLGEQVTPLHLALGGEEGVLQLTSELGTENYVSPGNSASKTVEVKVTTLDQVLERMQPTLIKIDVEGFETMVIAGARQTLARPSLQALIIERSGNAERYGYDEPKLHHSLRQMSFMPYAYAPESRSLNRLPDDAVGNLIYLKDLEAARKRLQQGRPYQFAGVRI